MAAVSIHPSPQTSFAMSNRRTPLANVSNAANSPHHGGLVPMKRPRAANSQLEINCAQPPIKKQMLDREDANPKSPSRKFVYQGTEGKVFTRKNTGAQPTAFERKLVASREKERQNPPKGARYEKLSGESLDTIRQWQKHYRKMFPQFVFYFEGIPEDMRNKCTRQVMALGANEEKFFSKVVTHVVTSRPIPPEIDSPNSAEAINASVSIDQRDVDGTIHTVNPSLLEKTSQSSLDKALTRCKNPHERRIALADADTKKEQSGNTDVLYRARQMHMKIWALEKLQRVISTMNDGETASQHGHYTRSYGTSAEIAKARAETDLSQVLRNDRLNGPSDRDASGPVWRDLIPFRGPFIYIRDVEGKTRPVMVRDYPKVARRQDGAWPQFRSASLGKCPFIDELPSKKELGREKSAARTQETEKKAIAKEKLLTTIDSKAMRPPDRSFEKKPRRAAAAGVDHCVSREEHVPAETPAGPHATLPASLGSPRKSTENITGPHVPRPLVYLGREPAASGVQPSNITSAIRSQMISSTAAAPGAKAGTSKEVYELKRKVLEKSNGGLSMGGMANTHRMTDIAGALKAGKVPVTRAAKNRAQEKLSPLNEAVATQSDEDGVPKRQTMSRKNSLKKTKEGKRDPKPGYCENCRDKFGDFEEHVMTRKHRKFAITESNWVDLDALLRRLQRPLKQNYDFSSREAL